MKKVKIEMPVASAILLIDLLDHYIDPEQPPPDRNDLRNLHGAYSLVEELVVEMDKMGDTLSKWAVSDQENQ